MSKPILDATCASRMMWFDKNNPLCLYVDKRELDTEVIWKSYDGKSVRYCSIHPDVVADFTDLPFEDETFYLVVFDPPHLLSLNESSWMCKKYGKIGDDWQQVIHDGFNECWRVLKPNGTLIFKWCELEIPTREVIKAIGREPLFGHRSGKRSKTHWMTFFKCADAAADLQVGDKLMIEGMIKWNLAS